MHLNRWNDVTPAREKFDNRILETESANRTFFITQIFVHNEKNFRLLLKFSVDKNNLSFHFFFWLFFLKSFHIKSEICQPTRLEAPPPSDQSQVVHDNLYTCLLIISYDICSY